MGGIDNAIILKVISSAMWQKTQKSADFEGIFAPVGCYWILLMPQPHTEGRLLELLLFVLV